MTESGDRIGCKECGWTGVIEQPDGRAPRECECGMVRRLARAMPEQVREAKVERAHLEHVLYSKPKAIGTHLYVTAHWADMCAIIQALMIRHMGKPILVTNDAEVKSVFVGSKSKSSRSDDFKGVIYNDLLDLMSTPGLMIMKLGEHTSANKALPKAFEEAIRARFYSARPLWLVSDPDQPFGRDSVAWSDRVWDLIQRTCIMVQVPKITNPERVVADRAKSVFGDDFLEAGMPSFSPVPIEDTGARRSEHAEAEERRRAKPARKKPPEEEPVDPALAVYGSGVSQSKSTFRRGK